MPEPDAILPTMTAEALRESWPGRALIFAERNPQLLAALHSLIADAFDEAMPVLLHVVGQQVRAPFYCSNPKIDKAGRIVADMVYKEGVKLVGAVIFKDVAQMQDVLRRLCDRLKLSDADRVDLFARARAWVKSDMRLDPTMDRNDPDARRLKVN